MEQLRDLSAEQSTSYFYNIIHQLMDKYIPRKLVTSQSKYLPWYSRTLIKLIRQKLKVHAK